MICQKKNMMGGWLGTGIDKMRFNHFIIKSWWDSIKNLDPYYKTKFCLSTIERQRILIYYRKFRYDFLHSIYNEYFLLSILNMEILSTYHRHVNKSIRCVAYLSNTGFVHFFYFWETLQSILRHVWFSKDQKFFRKAVNIRNQTKKIKLFSSCST